MCIPTWFLWDFLKHNWDKKKKKLKKTFPFSRSSVHFPCQRVHWSEKKKKSCGKWFEQPFLLRSVTFSEGPSVLLTSHEEAKLEVFFFLKGYVIFWHLYLDRGFVQDSKYEGSAHLYNGVEHSRHCGTPSETMVHLWKEERGSFFCSTKSMSSSDTY